MELDEYGFEKTELMQIAEKIYDCRGKKQQLEIELSSEEFHRSYIPKREAMTGTRILANFPLVFIFVIGILTFAVTLIMCVSVAEEDRISYAYTMLGAGLFVVYTAKFGFPMIKEQIHMMVMFLYSSKPDRAMRFANKHGISTFQDDKIRCDERIANLKARIEVIDKQIKDLENRQDELINLAKRREDVLRKYDIVKDEDPDIKKSQDKVSLTLKKDDMEGVDITELYEYYDKEESFTRYIIKDLEFKITSVNKEIDMINKQFEQVKQRIITFLCIYVMAIVIQGVIPGVLGGMLGGVCLVVGLIAIFAIERACRGPVLRYLIEKESPLVNEYCFKNDIIPVKCRRQNLIKMLRKNEAALNDVKKRKQALDYDY